jgi:ADP-L-glycero-D-manno-heptose 6-epimerase
VIIVTGAAGFIGSNLVKGLNERGRSDVLAVDDLSDGRKFENLADCEILDLVDRDDFIEQVLWREDLGEVHAVFHQGACSNTMEWDGRFLLRVNFEYSKELFGFCAERGVPFIYASSAAVYGGSREFRVDPACERPLNLYAYSKLLFDRWLRQRWDGLRSQVVGLRYFNVYGPRESHKGEMASVAYKQHLQLARSDTVELFEGSDGFADGEQLRDFVWVGDVVDVNLWCLDHPGVSGIFNVGTGRAQSFNDVARAVIGQHGRGRIEYVPFPDVLRGRYQSFTQADLAELRAAGYERRFLSVEEGVPLYLKWLQTRS